MKRVALLGFPISHSVSPLMHNAAFSALKLPWHYEALETSSADLPQVVDKLRHEGWVGANVTVPHKVDIIDLLDEVTPPSDEIGAVNTIVNEGGHLKGYNTDLPGFLIDLHAQGVETTGRSVLLLVVAALHELSPSHSQTKRLSSGSFAGTNNVART